MSALINFDIDKSFWVANPTARVVKEFRRVYDDDKTKEKEKSSKLMWCLALYSDTTEHNILGRVPQDERLKIIESDYLGEKLDLEPYQELIKKYKHLFMSRIERSMNNLLLKLDEREDFLKRTPYTIDNARDLDNMVKNTNEIYAFHKKLQDEIDKDKASSGNTKGGRKESASELKRL